MWANFLSSLVITLREGIEGALAVAIVLLYLRKTGRQLLTSSVWWGLGAAVLGSIGGAVVLQRISLNGEIVEGILMFVAAFFVTTMIVWMWRSAKGLKKEIEAKIDEIAQKKESGGGWFALFAFTFLMIFREGIETVIFLSAVNLTTDALISFLGGITGLVLAVLFGVFFVRGSIRIDLGRFFKITGIVLLLFVIQLVVGGFHELGEGGLISIGPREMAIVGPFVKNNTLFLIGVLLIPFLMYLIPARQKSVELPESAAERRLLLAQHNRQRMWRTASAVLSLFIVLFIGYDFVYGQSRKTLTPPEPLTSMNGEVRIPVSVVSDGELHRYILSGSKVRLIVLKTEETLAVAFDACEICGSQGYVQEAGSVICLNCSADINAATIGRGGGCNPIPLAFRVEGGFLIVRVDELMKQAKKF